MTEPRRPTLFTLVETSKLTALTDAAMRLLSTKMWEDSKNRADLRAALDALKPVDAPTLPRQMLTILRNAVRREEVKTKRTDKKR